MGSEMCIRDRRRISRFQKVLPANRRRMLVPRRRLRTQDGPDQLPDASQTLRRRRKEKRQTTTDDGEEKKSTKSSVRASERPKSSRRVRGAPGRRSFSDSLDRGHYKFIIIRNCSGSSSKIVVQFRNQRNTTTTTKSACVRKRPENSRCGSLELSGEARSFSEW